HGHSGTASSFQKRKVLHVASADLNHIAVLFDELDMRFLDGFSHNLQAELLSNGYHDFPAFFAEPLEHVRRRSRFPYAAAEKSRTTLVHDLRYRECLLATLNRARSSDDCQVGVANCRVLDANHGFVRSQIECY